MRAQPEMSRNVQKYSKDVYLRASEAQQCRVHSTIVLPLFTTAERKASLGVVEVVQTRQDMSFAEIVSALARSLEVRRVHSIVCNTNQIATPLSATTEASSRHEQPLSLPFGVTRVHRYGPDLKSSSTKWGVRNQPCCQCERSQAAGLTIVSALLCRG